MNSNFIVKNKKSLSVSLFFIMLAALFLFIFSSFTLMDHKAEASPAASAYTTSGSAITNESQFKALRNTSTSGYLAKDIELTNTTGYNSSKDHGATAYSGTLYGNGKTITINMAYELSNITDSPTHTIGLLFSFLSGTVRDCTIVLKGNVSLYEYTKSDNNYMIILGIICGELKNGTITNVNVVVNGALNAIGRDTGTVGSVGGISDDEGGTGALVGGFAGFTRGGTISDCNLINNNIIYGGAEDDHGSDKEDSSTRVCVGGFVGEVAASKTLNMTNIAINGAANSIICANSGVSGHNAIRAGGIIGQVRNGATVNITGLDYKYKGYVVARNGDYANFIVGRAWSNTTIAVNGVVYSNYVWAHAFSNTSKLTRDRNIITPMDFGSTGFNGTWVFSEFPSGMTHVWPLQPGNIIAKMVGGITTGYTITNPSFDDGSVDFIIYNNASETDSHTVLTFDGISNNGHNSATLAGYFHGMAGSPIYAWNSEGDNGFNVRLQMGLGTQSPLNMFGSNFNIWGNGFNKTLYITGNAKGSGPFLFNFGPDGLSPIVELNVNASGAGFPIVDQSNTVGGSIKVTGGTYTGDVGSGVFHIIGVTPITVTGGTITSNLSSGGRGIFLSGSASAYLSGCTITSSGGNAVYSQSYGALSISGGTYNGAYSVYYLSTVSSFTLSSNPYLNGTTADIYAGKQITASSFTGGAYTLTWAGSTSRGTTAVSGTSQTSKFNLTNSDLELYASGSNIKIGKISNVTYYGVKSTSGLVTNYVEGVGKTLTAPTSSNIDSGLSYAGMYTSTAFSSTISSISNTRTGTVNVFVKKTLNYSMDASATSKTYDGGNITLSASTSAATSRLSYTWKKGSSTYSYASSISFSNVSDSGTYSLTLVYTETSGSYTLVSNGTTVSKTITINKRPITVTVNSNQSKIYGNSDPTFAYSITSGSLASGDSFTGTLSRVTGNTVGNYDIQRNTLTVTNINSYQFSFISRQFAITPRPITITAANKSKTYGNSDPALTRSITSGSLAYSDSITGSLVRVSGEDYGTYDINQGTVKISTNANCYNFTFQKGTFTINKRSIEVTANSNQSKIYGQDDPELSYSITDGSLVGEDQFYGSLSRAAGENAGNYNIQIGTLNTGNNNYNISFVPKTFVINKKVITIKADDKEIFYGDQPPTYTISYTGVESGDYLTDTVTCSYVRLNNAGSYTITVNPKTYTNYQPTYQTGKLTVKKYVIRLRAENKSITYGNAMPALTVIMENSLPQGGSAFTIPNAYVPEYEGAPLDVAYYSIKVDDSHTYTNYQLNCIDGTLTIQKATVEISGELEQTYVYDGTVKNIQASHPSQTPLMFSPQQGYVDYRKDGYQIMVTFPGDNNYNATYKYFTLIIQKRDITITSHTLYKEYGYNDPTLTFDYEGLAPNQSFVGSLSRTLGESVGFYQITQGNLRVNDNYNYTFIFPSLFEIKRRTIEITANAFSKIYGESDPSFTYDVTDGEVRFGDALIGELTRAAGENAGQYQIQQGTLNNTNNPNYNIAFVSQMLTIQRRDITITANSKNKTYGDDEPILDYTITSGYLIGDDAILGSLSREIGIDVGIYNILQNTVNNANNPNYNITFVSSTFIISAKAITVTAQSKVITYGDDLPNFTLTYGTLPYGDTLSYEITTNYERYDDWGEYDIVITEDNAKYPNYIVEYKKGTLVVTKKAITVKADDITITYGDNPPIYTISHIGVVNNDTLVDTVICSYQRYDNAGSYQINVTPNTYTNYVAIYETGVLTVNKKSVIIRAEDETIVYGEVAPEFTINYTGIINDDTLTATATTVYQRYDNAGEYDITITPATYTNYAPDYRIATLTVNKAQLAVSADSKTITYGDALPEYTITYIGLLNGDTITDTVECEYYRYGDAGTYLITVKQRTYTNYTAIYSSGTLTVNKKDLEIIVDNKTITYGDNIPEYTISYIGLVNNDQLNDEIVCDYVRYGDTGEYEISVTRKTYTNYNAEYTDGLLTVNKRAITVRADDKTITYGDSLPEFTFTSTNVVNNDNLSLQAVTEYDRYEDAGSYVIEVIHETYKNYTATFTNGTLKVNKALLTVIAEDKYIKYGEAAPEFTFIYQGLINNDVLVTHAQTTYGFNSPIGEYPIAITTTSYTNYQPTFINGTLYVEKGKAHITAELIQITYYDREWKYVEASLNHTETTLEFSPSNRFMDVGTYYVTVSAAQTENYNEVSVIITFIIEKRQVFIDVDHVTKIYGEADPALTYEYSGLFEGDILTGELVREQGETVGDYDINLGTVSAGDNYQIVFTKNVLSIQPRPLTLTAHPATKVYGDEDPVFEYTRTEGNLIGDDTLTGSLSRISGRDVGTYEITIGTVNNYNYSITLVKAYLTITPRPITISADDITKMYGEVDPELTYEITSGELAYDDTIADTVIREPGEDVGIYQITINSIGDNNYDVSYEGNTFTIYERPITVTAHAKTKVYGDDDLLLTYYISQGSLAFDDTLNGELAREAGQHKGVYNILQNTLTNANNTNYIITYVGSIYTILTRDITILAHSKEKIYGEVDPELTYEIQTGSLAYSDILNGAMARTAGEDVGTYVIHCNTLNNDNNTNYNITFIENDFVINRRPITIQAQPYGKTYGYNEPVLPYDIVEGSLVEGDELAGRLTREQNENQGVYPIYQGTVNNENNNNYDISFIGDFFTIRPRYITITADYTEKDYGDIDPVITYRVSLGSLAYNDKLNGALEREAGEERGDYNILQGSITNDTNANYDITFIGNTFRIVKRRITVQATAMSKTYGESDPALTYEITAGGTAFDEVLTGQVIREVGENVGEYAIMAGTLTNENNINYEITFIESIFTVYRRSVILTAASQKKTYGYADPEFTYQITDGNLVFGDALTGELSRKQGEDVGTYPIEIGTLGNENYEIMIRMGSLIIDPRPITIRAIPMSFLHGSQETIDLDYTISGTPLPEDEELIRASVRIFTSAQPDSRVDEYRIQLAQIDMLKNYTLTLVESTLTIMPGTITDVFFNDMSVVYDGFEHILEATGEVDKYNVEYLHNYGTEVGVYYATAIFTKENYNDLTLNARLIIMTNTISTAEMIPQGILTIDEGVDPYVIPVIKDNNDEDIVAKAEAVLKSGLSQREIVNRIFNIGFYDNGQSVTLSGSAEVRLLIPKNVENLNELRLIHITDKGVYEVSYEIEGEYVVFISTELGDYAFITSTEEVSSDDRMASFLYYAGTGVLILIVILFMGSTFKKRKKIKYSKYV